MAGTDPATEAFLAHRNLLFTIAYEMLGSAADAEDVLQETWLRWAGVDLGTVRDQRAYLVRITTRQALSRLRVLGRRKESYVGPWLPEPLLTAPDVAEDIELADSVSMAMLLVLETLTPTERAVFVLREVFDLAYDEIAEAVGKSPAAVRQIARRARAHVAARRPRGVVSPAQTQDALEAFFFAGDRIDQRLTLVDGKPGFERLDDGAVDRKWHRHGVLHQLDAFGEDLRLVGERDAGIDVEHLRAGLDLRQGIGDDARIIAARHFLGQELAPGRVDALADHHERPVKAEDDLLLV